MSIEQGATHKESRRITSIGNSRRTMARDQYQYNQTTPKIKRQGHNCGHSGLIHQNN